MARTKRREVQEARGFPYTCDYGHAPKETDLDSLYHGTLRVTCPLCGRWWLVTDGGALLGRSSHTFDESTRTQPNKDKDHG